MSRHLALFAIILALFAAAPPAARSQTPLLAWKVAAALPHDASAFTQGLILHQGLFYESTGRYGLSDVRAVEPASGKIKKRTPLSARLFGEGLTMMGGLLYQLTWQEGVVLVYTLESLSPVGQLPLSGEGWGLTHDGARLIRSDGSNVLTFHDPGTFDVIGRFEVTDEGKPVAMLNELEYVRGMILANVWRLDKIAVISPASGKVLAWIDLSRLRPPSCPAESEMSLNGIACDPDSGKIYVTGKLWPKMFALDVDFSPIADKAKENR